MKNIATTMTPYGVSVAAVIEATAKPVAIDISPATTMTLVPKRPDSFCDSGAIVPVIQAQAADAIGLQTSFLIPAVCYAYILYFGAKYARMYVDVKAV